MNRIYKVIFNRAKGQYQVVSELAKNGGKTSGNSLLRTIIKSGGGVLTSTVLTAVLVFGSALYGSAEDVHVHDGDILNAGTNISVTSVTKDETTKTITISTDGVATSAEVNAVKTDVQKNQTAIADNTGKIADNSTKIAKNKSGINQNANDIQQNKTDIAANKNAITANTGKIKNNTDDITELKNVNSVLGLDQTKPGIKYFRANSTGEDAAAAGEDAVAIGVSAKANGKDSVALGDHARSASSAENSIAIGREAVSGSFNDMTTGDGDSSNVVKDGGKASISIGDAANARGNSSIALGDGATVYNDGTNDQLNDNSMAIGTKASTVASNNAIALGNHATVKQNSHSSVAIGDSAMASAADALAFGKSAAASGADSIAVGTEAAASGADALAMGKSAQASGADAIALGNGAVAGGSASVVLGKDASANAVRSVVLGPSAGVGMVGDVLGTKGSHVVIGDGAGNNIDGQQNIAIGYKTGNDVKSDHNVAIGSEAGTNIGSSGNTSEGKNVSIGYHANKNDSAVSRIQSTALGSETKAADDAVAVGYQAQANGNGSTAIGFNAQAADAASVALGQGAQAAGGNVAIGNDSVANAAMISGTGYLTGQAAPKTAVSVGNASALRRITNVADGALDQDAVTVAQLKKSIDATVAQVNANVSSATASGVYYDTVTSGDGDSITLRNNDNKGTKIHNVAAGTLGTDAANVAQVNKIVDTAKTHYYSVKSTDLNNYDNDLATGEDSMAAGVSAKALGDRSVALGNNTGAQSLGSITVGAGYEDPANPGSLKQTLAISGYQYNTAIGAGAQAAGNNSLAIGTLATSSIKNGGSSVDKAVAIGYSAGVSDDKAIAIGSDAKSNSKSASAMGDTAQALAENALAIGTNARAAGVSSGAIGTQNRVTGANTYVLGSQNSTAATGTAADVSASNSGIFGNENRMEGDSNRIVGNNNILKMESLSNNSSNPKDFKNIFVTGNDNTVTGDPDTSTAGDAGSVSDITVTGSKNTIQAKNQKNRNLTDIQIVGNQNTVDATTQNADLSNTQILGSHVTATLGNSVYLGSNSAYVVSGATTKGMDVYDSDGTYQYAGGTPAGIVTVGSAEKERRIQNVAAGLVSAKSTDAVNGSQLYTMTRPLRFAGDNSTIGTTSGSDVNVLHRGSDQAMSLLGGAASNNLSDKNIGVVADAANNKMTVKLANNITLGKADPNGSDGSISVLAEKGGEVRIYDGSVMLRNSGDSDAIYLQSHIAGATSLDGSSKARLYVIQGSTESPQEVALLTDGMIYGGDAESAGLDPATNKSNTGKEIKKVLNQQVNVIGGITNTTKFTAEDNLGVVSDGTNNLKVRLAKDLQGISSISNQTTTGGTTTGTKITLGNITNIVNVGGAKITNVAAGDVNSMSNDAVNGSQLYQTNQNIKAAKTVVNAGQNVTVTSSVGADGQSVYTVNADLSSVASAIGGTSSVDTKTGAVKAGLTVNGNTYNNVQDAVNAANTTVSSTDGSVKVTPTNNTNGSHNYDVSVDYSKVAENAAISYKANNSTAQTVTLKKGLDFTNGKNTTASVGADGVVKYDLNDDINLNSVTAKTINGDTIKAGDTTITTDGMTITNGPSITKTGIDAGSKKITNVADGDISPTSKDAINGSQLVSYVAANKTILKDGKNTTVTGNGTKDDPYKVNVNDNLNLGEKGTNGKDGSIGVNGTNGSSVTINGKDGSIGIVGKDGKDGLTMKAGKGKDGIDGKNGADGMTRITYTDDKNQSHEVATLDDGLKFAGNTGSVAKKLNETMTIKGTGTKADSQYDSSNIKTMVNDNGDMIIGLDKNLKADTVTVGGKGADGKDGVNGSIGVKGKDGKDGVTISSAGKDGADGTDGHIGINGKDGASADIHVVKGANGVDGTDGYNGKDGIDRIVYEDHNGHTQTVATMNDGMKYGGDTGAVINKKLNEQVNVIGGISDTSKLTADDNIGVTSDGSNNLKVRLSKDLKGLDTVTTKTITADTGNITTINATTVNGNTIKAGDTVIINNQGADMGGTKVTHLKDGDISPSSTDAVNGSQLYGTETRINRLGNRINRVGAGAAALAGLHPLDFDPDDKWDFAAGYGNYKNANAVAIGAYYRPNEDTMFSVGGSFSGGENMVNVGVSWKFGQKSHISRSRVSMAKDMLAMKNQIETLTKKLAAYESGQPVKLAPIATGAMTFPDVPENHWAYEYVKNLAERGYLKGYPDGEFKGDRAMTRYEYAAIIYRALQNGAPSDGNMTRSVDDFGPELVKVQNIDRFRVDRISGKDNDRHKVERVRVNDKDDKAQNVYRDVYGNHIQK
ncbi:ESPR-type extended signal peptide-containing protein [uncultured Megasphaera sp.]|nr:ESPR-type extended signal peptide-containing protein [uncultured Megasphaera sp.]